METYEQYSRAREEKENALIAKRNKEGEEMMDEDQKRMSEERTEGVDDPNYFEKAGFRVWHAYAVNKDGELFVSQYVDKVPELPAPMFYLQGVHRKREFVRPDENTRTHFAKIALKMKDAPEWLLKSARLDLKGTESK